MNTPFRIEVTCQVNKTTKVLEYSIYNHATKDHSPFMSRASATMFLEEMVHGVLEKASVQALKEASHVTA